MPNRMQNPPYFLTEESLRSIQQMPDPKVGIGSFLRMLLSTARDHFRPPFRSENFSGPYFEASNLTKWRTLSAFYHLERKGSCLVPHHEGPRTDSLLQTLKRDGVPALQIRKMRLPLKIWPLLGQLIWNGTIKSRADFLRFRWHFAHLLRIQAVLKHAPHHLFFYSSEDLPQSLHVCQFLRGQGIRTINCLHGRTYEFPIDADVVLGFCLSQLKPFVVTGAHVQKKLVEVFRAPDRSAFSSRGLKRIVFFDQPPFELLPDEVRSKVVDDLKALKSEFGALQIFVQPHPASSSALKQEWIDNGFSFFQPGDPFELGITICSTTGWDNFSLGIPTLYTNYQNVMANYRQLDAFRATSVSDSGQLRAKITQWLASTEAFQASSSEVFENLTQDIRGALKPADIYQAFIDPPKSPR